MRKGSLAILWCLMAAAGVFAQEQTWRFRWQTGQVLTYRVEHVTSVAETLGKSKVQTSSKLDLLKQWKVLDVDEKGVATLQMSLAAMRNEQHRPNGEVLVFDSKNPEKSTKGLKEHLMKFIGKPLAEIDIGPTGRVLRVKQGSVDRYEMEPPFQIILPFAAPTVGKQWEREYTITLNPPHGTGENYQAVRRLTCAAVDRKQAKILLKTEIRNLPESQLDQVPLFQKQPEGEVIFDIASGRMQRAHIRIVRDLENHQGKGSSYHFESDYTEEFVAEAKQ